METQHEHDRSNRAISCNGFINYGGVVMSTYRLINDVVRMRCISEIKNIALNNQVIEVVIQPEKTTRRARANRYYWAVVNCIAEYAGETPEYLHEEFKEHYLKPTVVKNRKGSREFAVFSTAKLSVKEFCEYLEKCIAVGHKLNIKIPHPEDEYHDQFLREYGHRRAA